eukprot:3502245-Rhodomonas_salina.1
MGAHAGSEGGGHVAVITHVLTDTPPPPRRRIRAQRAPGPLRAGLASMLINLADLGPLMEALLRFMEAEIPWMLAAMPFSAATVTRARAWGAAADRALDRPLHRASSSRCTAQRSVC